MAMGEIENFGAFRRAPARLARIGKEGDRWLCADKDELFDILQRIDDLLSEIRDAFDDDASSATLNAGRESVTHDARAGLCGNAARRGKATLLQPCPANEDRCALSAFERLCNAVHRSGGNRRRPDARQ